MLLQTWGCFIPILPPQTWHHGPQWRKRVLQLWLTQNKDTDNFVSSTHAHPPATSSTHLPMLKLHHPKGTKCQANCLNLVDLGRSCNHIAWAKQRESYIGTMGKTCLGVANRNEDMDLNVRVWEAEFVCVCVLCAHTHMYIIHEHVCIKSGSKELQEYNQQSEHVIFRRMTEDSRMWTWRHSLLLEKSRKLD